MTEKIKVKCMGKLPAEAWEDFCDEENNCIATFYTLEYAKEENKAVQIGITKTEDEVYDIIVDAPVITREIVEESLKKLSQITGRQYFLIE